MAPAWLQITGLVPACANGRKIDRILQSKMTDCLPCRTFSTGVVANKNGESYDAPSWMGFFACLIDKRLLFYFWLVREP
jgi:hypothetical protein